MRSSKVLLAALLASSCSALAPPPPQARPQPQPSVTVAQMPAPPAVAHEAEPERELIHEPPATFDSCTQAVLDRGDFDGSDEGPKRARACRSGEAAPCLEMAAEDFSRTGWGSSEDCRRVVLHVACERNDSRSCLAAGLLGDDPSAAIEGACRSGIALACAVQHKTSCSTAACQVDLRTLAATASDEHADLLASLLLEACQGDKSACALYANLYASRDDALAKIKDACAGIRKKRCDQLLGQRTTYGHLTSLAEGWMLAALCDQGDGQACTWLALTTSAEKRQIRTPADRLRLGCQQGSFVACVLGGDKTKSCSQRPDACGAFVETVFDKDYHSFRFTIGEQIAEGDELRAKLLEPSCAGGHKMSCRVLVEGHYHMAPDRKRELLARACPPRDPDPRACAMLADVWEQAGSPAAKVRKLRRRACFQLGAPDACFKLSGDEKTEARQLLLLDKACSLRHRTACMALEQHYEQSNPAKSKQYRVKTIAIPMY